MTVTITIITESADDARKQMADLLGIKGEALLAAADRYAAEREAMATTAKLTLTPTEQPAETTPKKTRARKDTAPNISATPEDRRPPEDDAETAAQDAADEAAEVEATRAPDKPLTVDDVMAEVGGYVQKHGMPAAQEDGPAIFSSALGTPPAGEQAWRKSLLASCTQDQLQKALAAWKAAAEANKRFGAKEA